MNQYFSPLAFTVSVFLFILSSCATDESQFDNNLANDAFQKIIMEDGVSENHLIQEQQSSPKSAPPNQYDYGRQRFSPDPSKRQTYQQRHAPKQRQQFPRNLDGAIGGQFIGDSIPMNPDH